MRDINRIDPFLDALGKLWKIFPDLRFAQVVNMLKNSGGWYDMFYVEDNKVLEVIDKLIEYEEVNRNCSEQ